jgi:hypothetical protein
MAQVVECLHTEFKLQYQKNKQTKRNELKGRKKNVSPREQS